MLHAVTMTLVGLKVAFLEDWSPRDLVGSRDELVSAFLALELAYHVQVRGRKVPWPKLMLTAHSSLYPTLSSAPSCVASTHFLEPVFLQWRLLLWTQAQSIASQRREG